MTTAIDSVGTLDEIFDLFNELVAEVRARTGETNWLDSDNDADEPLQDQAEERQQQEQSQESLE